MKQSALLRRILAAKRAEISLARKAKSLQLVKEELVKAPPCRGFATAIRRVRAFSVNLIAEIKRASPGGGIMKPKLDAAATAREFEKAGASCISVLTDRKFFRGSLDDLTKAKQACTMPVLRKDFIVDEYQVYESRLAGADAILLIACLLNQKKMEYLATTARNLSLGVMVEVHTEAELKRALDIENVIIGINNRDLGTLKVRFETALELRPRVPSDRIVVCESGVVGSAQMDALREARFDAVLVGEALMRARNSTTVIHQLLYA